MIGLVHVGTCDWIARTGMQQETASVEVSSGPSVCDKTTTASREETRSHLSSLVCCGSSLFRACEQLLAIRLYLNAHNGDCGRLVGW